MQQKNNRTPAATGGAAQQNAKRHTNYNPVETLLSRLEKVRNAGHSQWFACCPSHDDKTPSLSIREANDGTVLLHCFGGCSADEVVGATGLTFADLFPNDGKYYAAPRRQRWDYKGLLNLLRRESTLVMICASDVAQGRALTAEDYARLRKATNRITRITEVAHDVR